MHGIRARYLVKIRRGPRRVTTGTDSIDGKVFEFRPGWQLTSELGGLYAGEGAMVTCDPEYPESAPTWIPSGDLIPLDEMPDDLLEQAGQ